MSEQPRVTTLNALNIQKVFLIEGKQHYVMLGDDKDGNEYCIGFCCLPNYTESIDKALSRLSPVSIPFEEEKEEENEEVKPYELKQECLDEI
jgi:hypothetical protein